MPPQTNWTCGCQRRLADVMGDSQPATPVTLVTGAASGMGEAVAKLLVERNHSVVAMDINSDGLERLSGIQQAVAAVGDVAEPGDCEAAVATAVERFGGLNGVVHCAGVLSRCLALDETRESVERTMRVNYMGTWNVCVPAAREMTRRGGGSMVIISSVGAMGAYATRAMYCSSKAAATMLGKVFAMEWGPLGIRVNVIAPGSIKTPMSDPATWQDSEAQERFQRSLMDNTALHRQGSTAEIAAACLFLLSDESSYITGVQLPVDGGQSA
jgi:NAD(P)-dependent dehydrogenase (short-subunit alcohol dehydrogenase family)